MPLPGPVIVGDFDEEPQAEKTEPAASEVLDRVSVSAEVLLGDLKEMLASSGIDRSDAASMRLAAEILQSRAGELDRVTAQLRAAPRKAAPDTAQAIAAELERIQQGAKGDPLSEMNKARRKELRERLQALEKRNVR